MTNNTFLWVFFCYILGSFPTGYLIGLLSGKNVLEIGWRKTSGSNVFKNVGKWQGILTGILDIAKGYLAVYGSQRLGFPLEAQAFSGAATVIGHNWSIFLRFAGGRGIGTFFGGFLALSPLISGLSLIPFLVLAIVWNASIGTLLFLFSAIFLSDYFSKFETAGLFTVLCLAPIFIKRLSPIKEIFKTEKPRPLFFNRLIFDNDEKRMDLRIKRIYKKNPEKINRVIKTVSSPVWLPPKIGWQAAKFGVKVAKKPIQLLMGFIPERTITELDKEDLKNMMLAASRKIVKHQEEINKINVWPVADKDTGYNLAATLLGVEGVINQKEYNSISEMTQDIKEAAMVNARGNAGMIFTGYLIRFLEQIKNLEKVDGLRLSIAMRKGTKAAFHSIIKPTEGTILDVMKASGRKAYELAKVKKEKNIVKILQEAQKAGQTALQETKEKMEILKQNNVVDAGGMGFLKILEAWLENLKGEIISPENEVSAAGSRQNKQVCFESSFQNNGKLIIPGLKSEGDLEYRYDIVFQIQKINDEQLEKLKEDLNLLGNSIDILGSEGQAKIHIHANLPEKIKEKIVDFEISEWKVEDMQEQVRKIKEKKPLGLIAEEVAGLPKEFLEKNHILEVPFLVKFQDGEILTKENLFGKLEISLRAGRSLPKTSTPSFQDFLSVYQKALENFEEILAITLSSKLSGTYSSARIARSMVKEKQKITVFDCFSAGIGEGLAIFKIQELISQNKNKQEILETLKSFCPQIRVIGGLKDLSFLAGSGRIYLPKIITKIISFSFKAEFFSRIGIWFLFGIKEGKVRFFGIRFGKDLVRILIQEIEKKQEGKELKTAIAYGNNLKEALQLKKELEKKKKIKVLFVSQVSPAVGVYTGPALLMLGFYPD